MQGMLRVAVASPLVAVGNPKQNVENILNVWQLINSNIVLMEQKSELSQGVFNEQKEILDTQTAKVIVFPELCVTGYTCGDLFNQQRLLDESARAVRMIARSTCSSTAVQLPKAKVPNENWHSLIFIGAPVPVGNELFNCAIAICRGKIMGIVPKQNIPNYNEFYEARWFHAANGDEPKEIEYGDFGKVPFGTDLTFKVGEAVVHAEICEDLWMPIPPSSYAAIAGANVLVNLSASNETVAKDEYRRELVKNQSGRCMAAYLYASAGPTESTADVVFGGACLIAENGTILEESESLINGRYENMASGVVSHSIADVDIQKLQRDRRATTSFGAASRIGTKFREILCPVYNSEPQRHIVLRKVNGLPFVPRDPNLLEKRCKQIFAIQSAGLLGRLQAMRQVGNKNRQVGETAVPEIYIGVSGGLDSTLALLVAAKAYTKMGAPLSLIHGISMPGFGTSDQTKFNANKLMKAIGISSDIIDIRTACVAQFRALNHKPFRIELPHPDQGNTGMFDFFERLKKVPIVNRHDLVFENVQARMRTMLLMSKGFVLGTGDLSELALGWCTYNGDHMSMYNVNCSIPKTLVRFLVEYVANHEYDGEVRKLLLDIAGTTISPELLPLGDAGEIVQSTEDFLGPYILHDFFLYNFLRNGYSPRKILELSNFADWGPGVSFSKELRSKTLKTFITRFFGNQWKRECVSNGPKVGLGLSPRGDHRQPPDCWADSWEEDVPVEERYDSV